MKIEGSCACRSVSFVLRSAHPYPFNICYCSICRKTAGGGGFAINLGGNAASLEVTGKEHITVYSAIVAQADTEQLSSSPCERHFCKLCGSALWVWDPRWPELIHPFASAVDSELPIPSERTHLMLGSKASWVQADVRDNDKQFDAYPEESIAEWHQRFDVES
ncbi:MAG: hypothetical protein ACI9BW_000823 [Gammaproteobacteria bacterium]|jgi:hypothetical protein